MSKGKSIEECIDKAKKHIEEQGIYLLLFDVKSSQKYQDRNGLNRLLLKMMKDLNCKFNQYLPVNNLATSTRKEKGFEILLGDSSWAGINSSEIISKIINYQRIKYPTIHLYWDVAKNDLDSKGTKIVL